MQVRARTVKPRNEIKEARVFMAIVYVFMTVFVLLGVIPIIHV